MCAPKQSSLGQALADELVQVMGSKKRAREMIDRSTVPPRNKRTEKYRDDENVLRWADALQDAWSPRHLPRTTAINKIVGAWKKGGGASLGQDAVGRLRNKPRNPDKSLPLNPGTVLLGERDGLVLMLKAIHNRHPELKLLPKKQKWVGT